MKKKKVCMIVQDKRVKGGIAAVIAGYYGSKLEEDYDIVYVESYKDGGKLTKLLKGIIGYCKFIKVLMFQHPDFIHIHSSFGPSFYRKIPFIYMAALANKPIINHIHGADFEEFYVRANDTKKKMIQKVYNKCTCFIALSDEWKENLKQIVLEEKIVVIENYSVVHEDALQERLHRSCNHIVLFLGELGKRKGCYDIPEIAEHVISVITDAKFILCGSGSKEDEQAIKRLCIEKNILEHIQFPGWVRGEKKDKFLRDADIFLLPSYNEGMPMSILDAMGYGLPIVSTDVGGIPKIVHDGENGVCCNPGNINRFSESIIELMNDDDKRKMAAIASSHIVKSGYSLESHLNQLEKVYNNIAR